MPLIIPGKSQNVGGVGGMVGAALKGKMQEEDTAADDLTPVPVPVPVQAPPPTRADDQPAQSPAQLAAFSEPNGSVVSSSRTQAPHLEAGTKVVLQGLKRNEQFNGHVVTILDEPDTQNMIMATDGLVKLKIRRSHYRLANDSEIRACEYTPTHSSANNSLYEATTKQSIHMAAAAAAAAPPPLPLPTPQNIDDTTFITVPASPYTLVLNEKEQRLELLKDSEFYQVIDKDTHYVTTNRILSKDPTEDPSEIEIPAHDTPLLEKFSKICEAANLPQHPAFVQSGVSQLKEMNRKLVWLERGVLKHIVQNLEFDPEEYRLCCEAGEIAVLEVIGQRDWLVGLIGLCEITGVTHNIKFLKNVTIGRFSVELEQRPNGDYKLGIYIGDSFQQFLSQASYDPVSRRISPDSCTSFEHRDSIQLPEEGLSTILSDLVALCEAADVNHNIVLPPLPSEPPPEDTRSAASSVVSKKPRKEKKMKPPFLPASSTSSTSSGPAPPTPTPQHFPSGTAETFLLTRDSPTSSSLGFEVNDVTLRIVKVAKDTPAWLAGLAPGMRLLKVQDRTIANLLDIHKALDTQSLVIKVLCDVKPEEIPEVEEEDEIPRSASLASSVRTRVSERERQLEEELQKTKEELQMHKLLLKETRKEKKVEKKTTPPPPPLSARQSSITHLSQPQSQPQQSQAQVQPITDITLVTDASFNGNHTTQRMTFPTLTPSVGDVLARLGVFTVQDGAPLYYWVDVDTDPLRPSVFARTTEIWNEMPIYEATHPEQAYLFVNNSGKWTVSNKKEHMKRSTGWVKARRPLGKDALPHGVRSWLCNDGVSWREDVSVKVVTMPKMMVLNSGLSKWSVVLGAHQIQNGGKIWVGGYTASPQERRPGPAPWASPVNLRDRRQYSNDNFARATSPASTAPCTEYRAGTLSTPDWGVPSVPVTPQTSFPPTPLPPPAVERDYSDRVASTSAPMFVHHYPRDDIPGRSINRKLSPPRPVR